MNQQKFSSQQNIVNTITKTTASIRNVTAVKR